ncbi:MAG: glycosyltransferase family 2 protein, partial [Plesiomonas sp.]
MLKQHHQHEALAAFDPDWYLSAYPDVKLSGLSPLEHYHKYGLMLGRKPNPRWFSASRCPLTQAGAQLPHIASNQLRPSDAAPGTWVADGEDPHWYLDMARMPHLGAG